MNMKETVIEKTKLINKVSDLYETNRDLLDQELKTEFLEKLYPGLTDLEVLMYMRHLVSRHPEMKKIPWVAEFTRALRRLEKLKDSLELTKTEIGLKVRFLRISLRSERVLRLYQAVIEKRRIPDRKFIENLISNELSTMPREYTGTDTELRYSVSSVSEKFEILGTLRCIRELA